jgi:hypothetical protein
VSELFFEAFVAGVGNLIEQGDIYVKYFSFPLGVVEFAVDACFLAWSVTIFLEEALYAGDALVDAAAGLDVGLHLLLVVLNRCHFAHDNLLFGAMDH